MLSGIPVSISLRVITTAALRLIWMLIAFSGFLPVIFPISLVLAPVLTVFQIGPVAAHAKMNAIMLINVDMVWKPPGMTPTSTVVMIVVAASIVEVDTD